MKIMPLTPCQKARIGYWKAYKRLAEFRWEYADYECLCYMPWRHELRSAPLTGKISSWRAGARRKACSFDFGCLGKEANP